MKSENMLCIDCDIPMKKAHISYNELKLEARQCPKCNRNIFTEELTMDALHKMEKKRLQNEYLKNPIKIGHSWGITFPKEVAEVFGLNNSKAQMRIHPDIKKKRIEILI